MKPLALPSNQLHRFYRGGARIAKLRGLPAGDDRAPEDWVGSVTSTFGSERVGLSRLGNGRLLAGELAADPEGYLGPEHVARHGPDPALLVKLLDAGERLPVHFHPDRDFARKWLGSPYGKSEAWMVVAAEGEKPSIWLGLRDAVDAPTLADWVARQDRQALLAALNRVVVEPGDTFFVPAGLLHAIGAGLLIVELQEPSDLSVLLEWEGFEVDGRADGHLGLGFDTALRAATRDPLGPERLAELSVRGDGEEGGVERLLPAEADAFFRAERIRPRPRSRLTRELSILVVLDGSGRVLTDGGDLALSRGSTALVPWGAGDGALEGEGLDVLRCLPPELAV